ncbi:MAG: putative DNA binding domain-containing protein [Christensenellaceae bacterium]|jgi:ATP-dependent DNA helicase RecG|nr:putative DNA binding domain-containing protein [Christensenellaceae bacterium]
MYIEKLKKDLTIGENVCIEFKSFNDNDSEDVYRTTCAFLNRQGGTIYLGVNKNATLEGIFENEVISKIKNFIQTINNPEIFNPPIYIMPSIIHIDKKIIICINVHVSPDVHSYKNVIYDRLNDIDISVKNTNKIAEICIRKHNIFTERRVYKYITENDLREDLISRVRKMALNHTGNSRTHPWIKLTDFELLKSLGLYAQDKTTGEKGYNLAAVMLLGSDELIRSVVPAHRTDVILKKTSTDSFDERLIVETNLIESYDHLMNFATKHLLDKFYLEENVRFNLSTAILHELIVNSLIHREFTSSFVSKIVIERNKVYTENANRMLMHGKANAGSFYPIPKNPLISTLFRLIGLTGELGSGVLRLFKYGRLYSGKEPILTDGDVFQTIMPLNDEYCDKYIDMERSTVFSVNEKAQRLRLRDSIESLILDNIKSNPQVTQKNIVSRSGKSLRAIQEGFLRLQKRGIIERCGSKSNGIWRIY